MPDLTTEQIHQLAAVAGLRLDDVRAETIATRLSATLSALDAIPADALAGIEPAITFAPHAAAPPSESEPSGE